MRAFGVDRSGLLAAGVAAVALFSATPVLAASPPEWSIQSVAAPTAMQSTDAVSAVQKVTVNATGGTFTLTFEGQTTSAIAYNAIASSVESELDALSSIGAGITVTEDPGNDLGEHAYVVTFGGKLRGVSEGRCIVSCTLALKADGSSLTLGGGGGTAGVTSTTTGLTKDEYDVQVENIGGSVSSGVITLTDKLPPGVTTAGPPEPKIRETGTLHFVPGFVCSSGAGLSEVTCTGEPAVASGPGASYNNNVVGGDGGVGLFQVLIPVTVSADASGSVTNTATVSGGGAPASASVSTPNPVNTSTPLAYGVSFFDAASKNDTPYASGVEVLTGFGVLTEALAGAPPPETVAVFVTLPEASAETVTGIST